MIALTLESELTAVQGQINISMIKYTQLTSWVPVPLQLWTWQIVPNNANEVAGSNVWWTNYDDT